MRYHLSNRQIVALIQTGEGFTLALPEPDTHPRHGWVAWAKSVLDTIPGSMVVSAKPGVVWHRPAAGSAFGERMGPIITDVGLAKLEANGRSGWGIQCNVILVRLCPPGGIVRDDVVQWPAKRAKEGGGVTLSTGG